MTNEELNNYILHYIKADKTKSAIMLTGNWGTGKSYYIQNILAPFLAEVKNGNCQCITVSLYGLNDVLEISKGIYLESRLAHLLNASEKKTAGYIMAKTVAKGVTSFLGIDISQSEEDLNRLYSSIDLSDKLIVLEDLERSGINITEVLGYVNNLVEHDNVKVLLVANENEILKYHESEPDKKGKTYKIPDEKTVYYLETKEKTISDTVYYIGDLHNTIKSIILSFGNTDLNHFAADDSVQEIIDTMGLTQNYNLRSFIFACQKTVDIFEMATLDDADFKKSIFFGIIAFSFRIKCGNYPNWDGNQLVSFDLGIGKYPLYRFCYDYIRWHEIDPNTFLPAFEAHKKLLLYDKDGARNDPDLNILYSFFVNSEDVVLPALHRIEERLSNYSDIPFYEYNKLSYYLVKCNTILGFDYSLCQKRMGQNLRMQSESFDPETLIWPLTSFENDIEKEKYEDFSSSLASIFTPTAQDFGPFEYNPDDIHDYYDYVIHNESKVTYGHRFISKFDHLKLLDMIFRCTPSQLDEFRGILFSIYRHATKEQYIDDDRQFMEALRNAIMEKLNDQEKALDRILVIQIRYLLSNLQDFINQLS